MLILHAPKPKPAIDQVTFSPDGLSLVAPLTHPGRGVCRWRLGGSPPVGEALLGEGAVSRLWFAGDLMAVDGRDTVLHGPTTCHPVPFPPPYHEFGSTYPVPGGRRFLAVVGSARARPQCHLLCRAVASPSRDLWAVDLTQYATDFLFLPSGRQFVSVEWWSDVSGQVFVTRRLSDGGQTAAANRPGCGFGGWCQPPDRSLAAGCSGQQIVVFRLPDFVNPAAELKNTTRKNITGLAFHPSGRYLAATSNDATVKVYDTASWRLVHTLSFDVGRLRSVAFSPDGLLAAAGSDTGRVVVWDWDL